MAGLVKWLSPWHFSLHSSVILRIEDVFSISLHEICDQVKCFGANPLHLMLAPTGCATRCTYD